MKKLRSLAALFFLALAGGCAAFVHGGGQARILEVSRTVRYRGDVSGEQHEEFYVAWRGGGITLVRFEYRQLRVPNEVFAQAYVPATRRWHVFVIGAEDLRKHGKVSAWRVTLWDGEKLLAEQKSALW
ncbi:MAG: hypothetical protein N3B01_08625 [Verrucomicrobiae bacterium]|nr:hypothetical protein [Verrucomicrobiae bacterium]